VPEPFCLADEGGPHASVAAARGPELLSAPLSSLAAELRVQLLLHRRPVAVYGWLSNCAYRVGVHGAASICDVCQAPTQAFLVDLTAGAPHWERRHIVVERCTSLLCPTNLEDCPAGASVDGGTAPM
jgi:hypothetical protein